MALVSRPLQLQKPHSVLPTKCLINLLHTHIHSTHRDACPNVGAKLHTYAPMYVCTVCKFHTSKRPACNRPTMPPACLPPARFSIPALIIAMCVATDKLSHSHPAYILSTTVPSPHTLITLAPRKHFSPRRNCMCVHTLLPSIHTYAPASTQSHPLFPSGRIRAAALQRPGRSLRVG